MAAGLQHPHVASVLDYGQREDPDGGPPRPMLVMELVEGRPLSALIADDPLTPELASDLIAQAGEGLAAAHRKGIVHRDVKPGNLLVDARGQVKVTDFDISRAADAASLTLTGHLVGTPHYLSPEQAEGERATSRSDVYALGVVLYECLTGSKPFDSESPVVTALRHVRDPLPALPDEVPERLRAVVDRACTKDPAVRFADGAEMAAALRGEIPVWPVDGPPAQQPAPDPTATTVLPAATTTMPLATGAPGATGPAAKLVGQPLSEDTRRAGRWALAAVLVLAVLVPITWGARSLLSDGEVDPSTGAASTSSTRTSPASAAPQTVTVDPADYVGLTEGEARKRLEEAGLQPAVERRANPGGEEAGTVAEVSPTGEVDPGSTVTLAIWDKAQPAPAPKPDNGKGGKGKHGKKGKG
jgi:serine/threonine-protein kinase